MRVVVIGAGAAGLCALRHLKEKPELYEPLAFEKMDCIGGNWVYSDETDLDENGFTMHSNVYKNLKWVFMVVMARVFDECLKHNILA